MKKILPLIAVASVVVGLVLALGSCTTAPETPDDLTLGTQAPGSTVTGPTGGPTSGTTGSLGNASDVTDTENNEVDIDPTAATTGLVFALNSDGKTYRVLRYDTDATSTNVYIPYTYEGLPVTEIGNNAFVDTVATEISLPKSLVKIGTNAFKGTAITSIVIPAATTEIDATAFNYCKSLTSIEVEAENEVFSIISDCLIKGGAVIAGTANATIPTDASVTAINNFAFRGSNISTVVIPENITTVGAGAFAECSNLITIDIDAALTAIPNNFLQNCARVTVISIPETVTSIGYAAFMGTGISELDIPDAVSFIDGYAFANCAQIVILELPASLETLGPSAFEACLSLKNVVIPEGTVTIGGYAFKECYALQTIKLPTTLTKLGSGAFYNCVALKELRLPYALTVLGGFVVYGCSKDLYLCAEYSAKRIDWDNSYNVRYIQNADQSGLVPTVTETIKMHFSQPLVAPEAPEETT